MKVDLNRVRALADQAREAARAQNYTPGQRQHNRSWYRIENRADAPAGPTTDIYLYDMIGEWGITAGDFINELRGVVTGTITMYVNSEGGEVFDGLAIYEALRRHPANVTALVDGLAASAASFVIAAADRVKIAPHGKIMIHDAHGGVLGNARDMRAMADLLDALSDTIADIYAERSGGTREDWRAAMQAAQGGPDGTWYDAKAALKAKLVDEIVGSEDGKPGNSALIVPMALHDMPIMPEPGRDAVWSPSAFLAVIEEIEHPAEPVEILTGPALFAGLSAP